MFCPEELTTVKRILLLSFLYEVNASGIAFINAGVSSPDILSLTEPSAVQNSTFPFTDKDTSTEFASLFSFTDTTNLLSERSADVDSVVVVVVVVTAVAVVL